MPTNDYEVGYGKPPKNHQFKPGQSGNPKGRPKGAKNLKTDLEEELKESITVTEAGKPMKLSKQRALLKSLMARALKGDTRAANVVIGMVLRLLGDQEEASDKLEDLSATDQAILQAFEAKILSAVSKDTSTK